MNPFATKPTNTLNLTGLPQAPGGLVGASPAPQVQNVVPGIFSGQGSYNAATYQAPTTSSGYSNLLTLPPQVTANPFGGSGSTGYQMPAVQSGNQVLGSQTTTPTQSTIGPSSSGGFFNPYTGAPMAFGDTMTAPAAGQKPAYSSATGQPLTTLQMNNIQSPTVIPPNNFTVQTPTNISSSSTNPNTTIQDAMNAQAKAASAALGGTGNGTPSDSLVSQWIQSLYNAKLYSPEQQQALGQYSTASSGLIADQLAETRQIQALQENGTITQAQSDQMIQDTKNRYNNIISTDTAGQSSASLALQTLGLLQQNQVGALQSIGSAILPQSVAPGSSLMNSLGQTIGQGAGASPDQIANYAQSLYARDQSIGQPHVTQNGSIDWAYYGQQAKGLISSVTGQGNQGTSSGYSGGASTQVQGGTNQTQPTGTPSYAAGNGQPQGFGANGYGNVAALPQSVQPYVLHAAIGDQNLSFIDLSRVPDALKAQTQSSAVLAGIPTFTDSQSANSVYAAQQILGIVDAAKALSIRNLKPGTGGRIQNTLTNWANNFLQFNPDLSNFAQLKDAASKATTALAGGVGSGFRMNMGIIEAATQNLPTASDSLETAIMKSDALGGQIVNALQPLFPNLTNTQYGGLLNSDSTNTAAPVSGNPFAPGVF